MLLRTLLLSGPVALLDNPAHAQAPEVFAGLLIDQDYREEDPARAGVDLELLIAPVVRFRVRQSLRRGPAGSTKVLWDTMESGTGVQLDGWWETRGRWEAGVRVPLEISAASSLLVGGGLAAWVFTNGDQYEEFQSAFGATYVATNSLRAGPFAELGLRCDAENVRMEALGSLALLTPVTSWGGDARKGLDWTYEEYQNYYLNEYGEAVTHRDFFGGAAAVGLEGRVTIGRFQARLGTGLGHYGVSRFSTIHGAADESGFVRGVDLSLGILLGG